MNNLAQEIEILIPDGNGRKDHWNLSQDLNSASEDKYLQKSAEMKC
jgi:hypothetical protein